MNTTQHIDSIKQALCESTAALDLHVCLFEALHYEVPALGYEVGRFTSENEVVGRYTVRHPRTGKLIGTGESLSEALEDAVFAVHG